MDSPDRTSPSSAGLKEDQASTDSLCQVSASFTAYYISSHRSFAVTSTCLDSPYHGPLATLNSRPARPRPPPSLSFPLSDMFETHRSLQAAAVLSQLLTAQGTPHAFHGTILPAVLSNYSHTDEIFCIVEGGQGQTHPFRRVREAVAGNEDFAITMSPWTNRLHVSYRGHIPQIDIEILPAGETGPRHLDTSTVMRIQGIPFLTISEFVRDRLKSWVIRAAERDAHEICYMLTRYWNKVDINRIPEQDMHQFIVRNTSAAPAWSALKRKYGM